MRSKARARTAERSKGEETHERILEHAARAIRRGGYDGVSVADIMKEAGLTHGGFYAHFGSRGALVTEALERAASESLATMTAEAESGDGLTTVAERYLSDAHEKKVEGGCALAALGSETHRQPPEVRAIATRQVKAFLKLIEGVGGKDSDEARVILSALVGSLILARAVDSPELSRSLRTSVKSFTAERAHKKTKKSL